MRFYRVKIGQGEAVQYVARVVIANDGQTPNYHWTHDPKHAGEFLRGGTSRIVSDLLKLGVESVTVEEVS